MNTRPRPIPLVGLAVFLAVFLAVTGPRIADAGPVNAAAAPVNATAVVVGRHKGQEVARWAGALDWQGPLPIEFVGHRRGRGQRWTWQPHEPEELRIQASLTRSLASSLARAMTGVTLQQWARTHGATRVQVVIIPIAAPAPAAPASPRIGAPGATGAADAADAAGTARATAAPATDAPRSGTDLADQGSDLAEPDADLAEPGADLADQGADQGLGLAEQGPGQGRGRDGDSAHTGASGASRDQGRERGYTTGSEQPSWYDNPRAERVTEHGGRTPADHGERGGSAGGEAGGEGNTLGLGLWGGLFDAPDAIAPLVNAGLILADANFTHFGQKFLSRVVRGMGARALRKELVHEAAQVVARDMAKVRDNLARTPAFRGLAEHQQKAMLESTERAMERAYCYEQAGVFFERQAAHSADTAARYAGSEGVGQHIHQLTTENAEAYRQMAQAARRAPKRLLPGLRISNKQFGKKVGKHAEDFGLDAANASHRQWVRERIETIVGSYDEVRQGPWNPSRGGGRDLLFYRQGPDVVITKPSGDFVTILPGGRSNGWFRGASPL